VEVPNLTGQSISEASNDLIRVGLKLGSQKKAPNYNVPEGRIVEQNPAKGKEVKLGSSVDVIVSSRPNCKEERQNPDCPKTDGATEKGEGLKPPTPPGESKPGSPGSDEGKEGSSPTSSTKVKQPEQKED
jgi:beta-lactam-binding protein with PASTA domain